MANDREVLKVVWEGKIPVKFVADEDRDLEEQNAYFLLIPRVSYLPLVTDKVKSTLFKDVHQILVNSLSGQETLSKIHRGRRPSLVQLQRNSSEMAFPNRAAVRPSRHRRRLANADHCTLQEIPRGNSLSLPQQVRIFFFPSCDRRR